MLVHIAELQTLFGIENRTSKSIKLAWNCFHNEINEFNAAVSLFQVF